jgi:2-polyprenyl-3-methyl-5-hydroxy-6-metoxy-1,4-benzoquinol methylase
LKTTTRHKAPARHERKFDAAYFRKYYLDDATRVTGTPEMHRRAMMVAAVVHYAEVPVRTILDVGCGIGLLRRAFRRVLPRARYTGLEASEWLCKRYGWVRGSVVDYRPRRPSDLVVCYDVLQYLDDRSASRAIANLARMTGYALYISALTLEDWRRNCDRSRTDGDVHLRPTEWYRRRLARRFNHLGMGVWLRKGVTATLWDMEQP